MKMGTKVGGGNNGERNEGQNEQQKRVKGHEEKRMMMTDNDGQMGGEGPKHLLGSGQYPGNGPIY